MRNRGMIEENLLSLSYGRVVTKDISTTDGLLPESFETYQIVEPGDVVFRFTDLQNDKRSLRSARVSERGIITSAYMAFTPRRVDSRYFEYLMRAYDVNKVFYGMGGGLRQSLKFEDVRRMPVITPPRATQVAIADFLDRETAQIDALIEKQHALIDRLLERRQAVIDTSLWGASHTRVMKFAWSFTFHNGDRGASYPSRDEFVPSGVPFVNAGHLLSGGLNMNGMNFVTEEKFQSMGGAKLRRGDVLFCLRGSLGKFGMYPAIGPGALASSLVALRKRDRELSPRYFLYLLASTRMSDAVALAETGSAQPNLSVEQVSRFKFEIPALDDQRAVVRHLDAETARIDTLIAKAQQFVELARERRSALITAAVTGQLEVEHEAAA